MFFRYHVMLIDDIRIHIFRNVLWEKKKVKLAGPNLLNFEMVYEDWKVSVVYAMRPYDYSRIGL